MTALTEAAAFLKRLSLDCERFLRKTCERQEDLIHCVHLETDGLEICTLMGKRQAVVDYVTTHSDSLPFVLFKTVRVVEHSWQRDVDRQ